jgi:hypothetical protein
VALDSESLLPAPQTFPGDHCPRCGRRVIYAFPRGTDLRTQSGVILDAEAPCYKVTEKEMAAELAYAFVLHEELCRGRVEARWKER